MGFGLRLTLKVIGFCFLIIIIQTAIVDDFFGLQLNLPYITLISFASLLGIFENVVASLFFCSMISLLSYDSHVPWIYLIIAIIANKINPENIADKLIVCIVFCLLFTPILEMFNPNSSSYFYRVLSASLINVVSVIPMYFLVDFLFSKTNTLRFSYD